MKKIIMLLLTVFTNLSMAGDVSSIDHYMLSPREIRMADYTSLIKKNLVMVTFKPMFDTPFGRMSRTVLITCNQKTRGCAISVFFDKIRIQSAPEFMLEYAEIHGKPHSTEKRRHGIEYYWVENGIKSRLFFRVGEYGSVDAEITYYKK